MAMSAAHPRILGSLGRALSLELSAVQQYMTHASLVEMWGETEAAERFRQETVEEMRHSERIVKRMLALGVAPAASQLRPVEAAADLEGLLRHNAMLEEELIHHYAEALRFCVLIGDKEHEAFFRALWDEERQHGEDLARWQRELQGSRHDTQARASF
jgi:bacterioferritin